MFPILLNQFLSDQIIALAYFSIPVWLAFSAKARHTTLRRNGNTWMLILFAVFITACGFGHQIDAIYEWRGVCAALSPLKTVWNWITAVSSFFTAGALVPRAVNYMTAFFSIQDMQHRLRDMENEVKSLENRFPNPNV